MRKASAAIFVALCHSRNVMTETSPTSHTAKSETSDDGQSSTASMKMKAIKAPAKK